MIYANKYGIKPADRIIEPIFPTGISKHHCVFLGMDYQGTEWISENNHVTGVRLVDAGNYFSRNKPFQILKFNGNPQERKAAVQRALDELGKPYDLINYNCEHYAEYVQYNRIFSEQVESIREGIKVAAFCLLAFGLIKLISYK
jgi:Lecithin retinol acyltransferase